MKTKTLILGIVAILLGFMIRADCATLMVRDLTPAEYSEFASGSVVATSAFQAGGSGGMNSKEILSTANISVSTDHVWPSDGLSFRTTPDPISVIYDASGNWISSAGTNSVVVQPLGAFNAVLVRVWYRAFYEPTLLENGIVNGLVVRDMSAGTPFDGTPVSDQLIIYMSDGSSFDEFSFEGDFSFDFVDGGGSNVGVEFIAINNPLENMLPEPNTGILVLTSFGLLLLRRKR